MHVVVDCIVSHVVYQRSQMLPFHVISHSYSSPLVPFSNDCHYQKCAYHS